MDFLKLNLLSFGGPMVWPLLLLAFLSLTFTVERSIFLHKGKIRAGEFVSGIKNLLRKKRLAEALTVCEETKAPVANVAKAALLNFHEGEANILSALQSAALLELPNLEKRISTLAAIARIAPLFGLIGTALSIYSSFSLMGTEGPYAHASLFSSLMAEALVSTIIGLILSAATWLAHHFLTTRIKSLSYDMEWTGQDIFQFIRNDLPKA